VSEPAAGGAKVDLIDVVAAVLLALATVATAWSGYQASRWNGEQAKAGARSNALRLESTRASGLADSQTQVDVATFTAWVDAYARDETRLADFYKRRFRAEFAPAVDAWIATRPLKNLDAPLTPFAMPQYRLSARDEAASLETRADALSASARSYVQRSTNYVLAVVLFSAALFFAGLSARLPARGMRVWLLGFGVALFVGTLVWIAVSPVSVSV
jgi:hypothetical protein